ncbi:class I lanthipeptide [Flavobacterium sp. 40-81]|uniref:class I lanthipeptide n=1 Tax=Flavobacterium sp. 40-81 TaxID=1896169 RepID=UPI001AC0A0BA|nr:class I lanthipeptide [Flavobacterium sp.]
MKTVNTLNRLTFIKNSLTELNVVQLNEINGGTSTFLPLSIFTKLIIEASS